jgi:hypothetical protein
MLDEIFFYGLAQMPRIHDEGGGCKSHSSYHFQGEKPSSMTQK